MHLHLPRTQKQQLQLHQQASNLTVDDEDDDTSLEITDIYVAYRRPRIVQDFDENYEVSDYVKTRLLIARLKAMEKYQEVWGNNPVSKGA